MMMVCVLGLISSCSTPSNIVYFKDLKDSIHVKTSVVMNEQNYQLRLIPSNEISIIVSGKDPISVTPFNLPAVSTLGSESTDISSARSSLQTYVVDSNGNIQFPILGTIHVSGMSRVELATALEDKIKQYVKEPIVNVHFLNAKIAVLGEVNSPGDKSINNERLSIMDAISLSGDMNIYANRKNILLIREEKGIKVFHRLDLTTSDIFSSPYYYLQQNDIVYVEPNKAKQSASKIDTSKQFNLSLASVITGAISTIASLCIALFIK